MMLQEAARANPTYGAKLLNAGAIIDISDICGEIKHLLMLILFDELNDDITDRIHAKINMAIWQVGVTIYGGESIMRRYWDRYVSGAKLLRFGGNYELGNTNGWTFIGNLSTLPLMLATNAFAVCTDDSYYSVFLCEGKDAHLCD